MELSLLLLVDSNTRVQEHSKYGECFATVLLLSKGRVFMRQPPQRSIQSSAVPWNEWLPTPLGHLRAGKCRLMARSDGLMTSSLPATKLPRFLESRLQSPSSADALQYVHVDVTNKSSRNSINSDAGRRLLRQRTLVTISIHRHRHI